MDQRSIEILEFPLVRERLAEHTSFGPSRALAAALRPESDPVLVARGLDETDEARDLLHERPGVGIAGARDIGPAIERAARGGRLDPAQFVDLGVTLEATARLETALGGTRRPLLRELAQQLHPVPALRSTIARSFDPAGELLDTASPRLGGLRAAVRIAFDRLRRRLDSLVASELGNALQEPLITLRNGRYVVPVKAEARSRVKGIVHDASGSGQTLFVEPLVVVELGNAWREAQLAEQEEVARILDELSALVGANAPALRETLGALARFDLWQAKAQLAGDMDASRAETVDPKMPPEVALLSARHPGLSGRVVPIDVRLGGDFTALVVTGPNTGGKTVTLRTLGLLALMHQAGLHVPAAPGSKLPVFRDIVADIGDEQSIAQSLSTFSGHMRRIIAIVEAAGPGTLVLLDELGAGTDPTEGSALAQALLDHFIRSGALVAATTHYAELKAYAHTTPRAMNAAVDFDLETLSPTYHLSIGLPGGSQAFAIAERLGLPDEIVADARSRLTETQRSFEATLASIREAEGQSTEAAARARESEARAAEALRAAEEERRRARRERDEAGRAARAEADRVLATLRDELAAARRALERGALTAPVIDATLERVERLAGGLPGGGTPAPAEEPASGRRAERRTWRVGELARSRSGGWQGRIATLDRAGRRATLEAATGLRVSVELADLEPADAGDGPGVGGGPGAGVGSSGGTNVEAIRLAKARSVPLSLDLRGARVDEALAALERYIEDASLSGLAQVTVIHGMGTGALRDAVRLEASGHPLVKGVRPGERGEGGDGATIVTIG
ncbi:MAG TPA: endonuclease MutS2 [Candidatus Limnocylindrales bacterium]|nr:endonuclease MutS2 [Candidatus Limnocylindrales bacterium]